MQPISRNKRIALLAVFLAYALWSVLLEALVDRYARRNYIDDADLLAISRWVLIGGTIYGFAFLWLLKLGRLPRLLREHPSRFVPRPRVMALIYSYVFLVSPLVYAKMLSFMGASFLEFSLFVGAAIIMGLVWGIYDLRNP